MLSFGYLLLISLFLNVLNRNVVLLGNKLHGFHEGKILFFHNESDSITATVTAETVKQVLMWAYAK